MCGIVGYVGPEGAADIVLEGLRKLEYRGYDSAGIASIYQGAIHLRRKKGKLVELQKALAVEPLPGNIAIGHTRWATHGRPSDENAHPHVVDDIVLVHNGIIENFHELKAQLQKRGRTFLSETDTEVIAHLVAIAKGSLEERVRSALGQVRGAYAVAVLSSKEPTTIVVAKNASPLVLGVKDGAGLIASDIPALLAHTRDVLVLEEGELAVVRPGSFNLSTIEGAPKNRATRRVDWSPLVAERGGHKHFMHKEIFEQPAALADTLRGRLGDNPHEVNLSKEMVETLAKSDQLTLTACGTSLHACLLARLAFEELARLPSQAELASELRYRNPVLGKNNVTLAVSQSGETADTLAALKAARGLGAHTMAVVNVIDSSIAREAQETLYTQAGPEIGVASTKALLTQVAVLYMLAIGVGRARGLSAERAATLIEGLRQMPRHIKEALECEAAVQKIAHKLQKARSALFLGRGTGFPMALEGALKLKEISYIHAEGYAAGELKHGPIALIEPEVPVIVIATHSPVYEKVISNMQEVRARDGYVIAIADEGDKYISGFADEVVYVPKVDWLLSPLVTAIPLQLLAYHVADLRGTDIDQPRNLAKSVTVE